MSVQVQVLEAADFPEQTGNQICAEVSVSGITELASAVPTSSPKWEDATCSFTIDSDNDNLQVSLFSGDGVTEKNLIGTGHLSLKDFDQENGIDEWVQLTDQNGGNAGRIHLHVLQISDMESILNGLDDLNVTVDVPKTPTTNPNDTNADKNNNQTTPQNSDDDIDFQHLLDDAANDENNQNENTDENQQNEGEETNQAETQNPEVTNIDDQHEEETINEPQIEENQNQDENENQNEDEVGLPSNHEDENIIEEEDEDDDSFHPANEEESQDEMFDYPEEEDENYENNEEQSKKLISTKTRQNALKENTLKLIIKAKDYPDENMKDVENELNSEVTRIKDEIKTESEKIYTDEVETRFSKEEARKKWLLNTKLSENSQELEQLKERHNDPQKMSIHRIEDEIKELKNEIEELDQLIADAKAQLNGE